MKIFDRLSHAWNAFVANEPNNWVKPYTYGYSASFRPDRPILARGSEKTLVNSIYNRIAVDVASIKIRHVNLDDNDRYLEDAKSNLNNCLKVEANIDQTSRSFFLDVVISMLDEGVVAIVPVDTTLNPNSSNSYDIDTMRVGKILQWYPETIQVEVYNDRIGKNETIYMNKKDVAIVENPFYSVMNERNSTLQRLIRKLAILDSIDEHSGSDRLDLIIQLPYVVKSKARQEQAEQRRRDLEQQLNDSKYGIAYTDGTEHITQLNRPIENNLLKQIEFLTNMVFSQLGMSQEILDGTANKDTMLNYQNRIVIPIVQAIVEEMNRKFLTKTARTRKQAIMYFNDPFKYISVNDLAEISDKFTRNEIMSTNEVRQIVGMKPSDDPKADELRNKNLNIPETEGYSNNPEMNQEQGIVDGQESNNQEMTIDDNGIVQLF